MFAPGPNRSRYSRTMMPLESLCSARPSGQTAGRTDVHGGAHLLCASPTARAWPGRRGRPPTWATNMLHGGARRIARELLEQSTRVDSTGPRPTRAGGMQAQSWRQASSPATKWTRQSDAVATDGAMGDRHHSAREVGSHEKPGGDAVPPLAPKTACCDDRAAVSA